MNLKSKAGAIALGLVALIIISLVAISQIGGNSALIESEPYTLTCNGHRIETTHHYWDEGSYWFRLEDGTYEPVGRGVRCLREER
jgi:hypothetical protein